MGEMGGEEKGGEGSGEGGKGRRREEEGGGGRRRGRERREGEKVGSYILTVKIDLMLLVIPILVFVLQVTFTGGISMLCLLVRALL